MESLTLSRDLYQAVTYAVKGIAAKTRYCQNQHRLTTPRTDRQQKQRKPAKAHG